MTIAEAKKENQILWYDPETISKAEPLPGAIEFLYELTSRNSNYIINSSRKPKLYESTVEWYRQKAPFVDPGRILTGLPDLDPTITKAFRIKLEDRRVHFEDVPEHAKTILDYTRAHVFLLSNSDPPDTLEPHRLTHIKGRGSNA